MRDIIFIFYLLYAFSVIQKHFGNTGNFSNLKMNRRKLNMTQNRCKEQIYLLPILLVRYTWLGKFFFSVLIS